MLISQPTLDALRTEFSMVYDKAYSETPVFWPKLATEVPSSTKSNTYGWIAKILKMRKWVGPRVIQNLSEHRDVIENDPYEGTVEVDRDDIEDDNLGLYTALIMPQLGQSAKKHPDQLTKADVLRGNPTCFDGKAVFAGDHPTFDEESSTYDNDYGLALTGPNFATVWSDMASRTGEDGEPLGVTPNLLVVPPQLRKVAAEIMNSTMVAEAIRNVAGTEVVAAAGVTNTLQGWAEILWLPELADEPTEWFLFDTTKAIKPIIVQVRKKPVFVARDNPQDPKVFDQKKFTYGSDWRGRVAPTLPFLSSRSKP